YVVSFPPYFMIGSYFFLIIFTILKYLT
ncbi:uncharacterized protein METZ01_LOCUS275464, partial [marine metagenome]